MVCAVRDDFVMVLLFDGHSSKPKMPHMGCCMVNDMVSYLVSYMAKEVCVFRFERSHLIINMNTFLRSQLYSDYKEAKRIMHQYLRGSHAKFAGFMTIFLLISFFTHAF